MRVHVRRGRLAGRSNVPSPRRQVAMTILAAVGDTRMIEPRCRKTQIGGIARIAGCAVADPAITAIDGRMRGCGIVHGADRFDRAGTGVGAVVAGIAAHHRRAGQRVAQAVVADTTHACTVSSVTNLAREHHDRAF